jgi:hypothetical protein
MSSETMEDKVGIETFSVPSIRTRMAEDLVPNDKMHLWYPKMGMTPGSEEGAAMEEAAGQLRRNNLVPILPSLDLFTTVASSIMQAAILLQEDKSVDDASLIPISTLTLANIAVTRSVIAQLIDFGILKVSGFTVEGVSE